MFPIYLHLKIIKEIVLKNNTNLLKELSIDTLLLEDLINIRPVAM